jgi:hypothetical protein
LGEKDKMIGRREGTYSDTLAFAPQMGQLDNSAATMPYADVFAHRERQSPALSPEMKQRTVHIRFGDRSGVITYPDSSTEPPPWLVPVLRSLLERRGVSSGWDSYDAKPTDAGHAARLLTFLFKLMRDNSKPPIITPLSDGGVQATWHRGDKDLEIVVPADEPPTYYFRDEAADKEEEEQLEPSRSRVQALIQQF